MAMMKTPVIICFANQKGGVGKTTLSICFANYLISKGVKCMVVDCDTQQSIGKRRRRDIEKYGDHMLPYPVKTCPSINTESLGKLLSEIFNKDEFEVVIFDCPCGMPANWEIVLINNSDIVVVPYQYQHLVLASTTEFILYVSSIIEKFRKDSPCHLFMIPNISDKRVGTLSELRMWDIVREQYTEKGTVTPKIFRQADMPRIGTVANLFTQLKTTSSAFDKIYTTIFGTKEAIRTPIPTLVVRDNPKKRKSSSPTPESIEQDADAQEMQVEQQSGQEGEDAESIMQEINDTEQS